MRTFDGHLTSALLVLLAGCSGGASGNAADDGGTATTGGPTPSVSAPGAPTAWPQTVECAHDGQREAICTLETTALMGGGVQLRIGHPKGGFRRIEWRDGADPEAADGAERFIMTPLSGGGIEARVGAWRYILPARPVAS